MNEQDRQSLHDTIQARMNELNGMLQAQQDAGPDSDAPVKDDAERLDRLVSAQQTVMQRERAELRQLGNSLEWLNSDEGGYCAGCGEEIQMKRLLTVPTTRHCIACAEQNGG